MNKSISPGKYPTNWLSLLLSSLACSHNVFSFHQEPCARSRSSSPKFSDSSRVPRPNLEKDQSRRSRCRRSRHRSRPSITNASIFDFLIIDVNDYIGGRVAHTTFGKNPTTGAPSPSSSAQTGCKVWSLMAALKSYLDARKNMGSKHHLLKLFLHSHL